MKLKPDVKLFSFIIQHFFTSVFKYIIHCIVTMLHRYMYIHVINHFMIFVDKMFTDAIQLFAC